MNSGSAIISSALILLLLGTGCVTERSRPVGATQSGRVGSATRPTSTHSKHPDAPRTSPASADAAALPGGPVATPAISARNINSEVRVAIKPIGTVPFDGQTLPLISPDGRFLATQTGESPDWPTILAQSGASVPLHTRIEVYDLSNSPPVKVDVAGTIPPGCMLGRSCTTTSFLVEGPQPDGSRWIASVDWVGGKFQWLVQGTSINAQAVALDWSGPAERMVFSRRVVGGGEARLIVLDHGVESELGSSGGNTISTVFPTQSAWVGAPLYAMEISLRGLDLVARTMQALPNKKVSIGAVAARRQIASEDATDSLQIASQAVSSMQAWLDPDLAQTAGGTSEPPPGLLFHNPLTARMCIFDPRSGAFTPLAAKSISGTWARDEFGWAVFVSATQGLMHQRIMRDDNTGALVAYPASRVLIDPYVPRATMNPERPYVLIGPGPKQDSNRVNIVLMAIVKDEP